MFYKVNDTWLGFTIKNEVAGFIKEFVGKGVFWGFKYFIDFYRVGLVIVFYTKQQDGCEKNVEDGSHHEDTTT